MLQQPAALERNHCFMTIGPRLRKANGALDARTPALWISNGTGRDGRERRDAPKVGWCWAGNPAHLAGLRLRDGPPDGVSRAPGSPEMDRGRLRAARGGPATAPGTHPRGAREVFRVSELTCAVTRSEE